MQYVFFNEYQRKRLQNQSHITIWDIEGSVNSSTHFIIAKSPSADRSVPNLMRKIPGNIWYSEKWFPSYGKLCYLEVDICRKSVPRWLWTIKILFMKIGNMSQFYLLAFKPCLFKFFGDVTLDIKLNLKI